MSPNMMLARTRPLPFQQGPFFIFLLHISVCNCNLNYFGETVLTGKKDYGLRAISTARSGAG
ncbi:hypothetical protein C3432_01080 [Citrobacter amalonaticus]|uniref:Uncharacterized protein n=1 Tax=Citrobacter amalonaticus TaxID=35703 RepID=A0A2S4S256_CITAM|nr:hypothetical protein C3432_01080 [Citrobacter amalonaticus]POT77485.1 hypothetical protein C3436_08750 [Citrobacter amalonaticus]POU67937.1 hypothetical protein C3430_02285 [Citrobacter amalonaticus]POV07541.1 hypothetical protein C3424_02295 [Citrobacter amalonaticus]